MCLCGCVLCSVVFFFLFRFVDYNNHWRVNKSGFVFSSISFVAGIQIVRLCSLVPLATSYWAQIRRFECSVTIENRSVIQPNVFSLDSICAWNIIKCDANMNKTCAFISDIQMVHMRTLHFTFTHTRTYHVHISDEQPFFSLYLVTLGFIWRKKLYCWFF